MLGIAFTTHNRHDLIADSLAAVERYTEDYVAVVVDDGSRQPVTVPEGVKLVRHSEPRGIPAAKNRCIAELMDLGVEHLFLFDDDTRPQASDWWRPYAEGDELYYTYCWTHFARDNTPVAKMDVLYRDSTLIAYAWSMGCCQYVHRDVIERVGGLDPVFGLGFEEHAEWAQRIHNAGFTTFAHQDHPGVKGKIWAGDEHYAVQRSFDGLRGREALIERNTRLRLERAESTEFIDYRA
ncbi:glycosyltransferase [Mycobacterium phage Ariel]|uniref:glycosyltransferase n=1 Tax=Mycobacterium phage Ariel TaxID=1541824 RepID=UPI0004F6DE6E|nr:glycosyltransferase [Mycobacterium phage Ariel]AIM49891.1 glycosyltransferase [Mycobacterium phage Ariel]